jgi:nitrogen regulatory protein P-II 2
MKLIIAMIQPHKLTDVKEELFKNDIHKMTVTNVLGCGQQKGFTETYRGVITEVNLLKKIRIEIAVNDEFEDKTIEAIKKGAYSGKIGDGKIFVLELARCIRIRTGEEGINAIG